MAGYTSVRREKSLDLGSIILFGMLTVVGLLMLSPIVYLFASAFKPTSELFLFPPRIFAIRPTLKNFYDLLFVSGSSVVPFSRYIFNSIFVSACVVTLGVIISAMAAYPLSKHKMPFRKAIFSMIILALMFSPQITQIPQYLVINYLGWINTYWALIIPSIAAPVGLFLMKQFLDQIPDALLEAANIDGASQWGIFRKIILPMLKPAVTTMVMITFVTSWNDTWSSSAYTTTEEMKTLPFALLTISGGLGTVARSGVVAAASLIIILPTLIVFIFTQRLALETMAHSGLKE